MPIFAAMRKGEARRIRESAGGAVYNFCDQRKRLQGSRPELFQQQQRSKIPKLAFVSQSQNGAKPFKVGIVCEGQRGCAETQ